MDTSETYIKMCEKAVEIQQLNGRADTEIAWDYGDYYWRQDYSDKPATWHIYDPTERTFRILPAIWLPRQDQLQEMVKHLGLGYQVGMFYEFVCSHRGNWITAEVEGFTSMEQLWLAFVMKQKYNKVWNGESWFGGKDENR